MKLVRVFPRRTSATPTDPLSFDGKYKPTFWDGCDEVHVSVSFTWDKPLAEYLADLWAPYCNNNVKLGGPAYDDPGGEFEPGKYLGYGWVITSRGCPNRCWYCPAWKREGTEVRELQIKDGWIVQDNNLLATSWEHQIKVFDMLARQPHGARFTGGLEARRFTIKHAYEIKKLHPESVWFAYDKKLDWDPLVSACDTLHDHGLLPTKGHSFRCYVLIGYEGDTAKAAEERMKKVMRLGLMPHAMLLNKGDKNYMDPDWKKWVHFQRMWANPIIVGKKMSNHRRS